MVSRVTSILVLALAVCAALPLHAQLSEASRRAFRETKSKADKGDAQSQLAVGRMYAAGIGIAADPRKAVKYYTKAAEQGLSQAQFQLALQYSMGDGVKADPAEAAHWFTQAAEQGLVEAELELGRCYLAGKGVDISGVEAVKWFRKAAEHGSAMAGFFLGKCYFEGTGLTRNIEEGLRWTRRAAEAGSALAQNALGNCYEKGTGVEKDYLQAYKWYALAAAQDDANAADIRVSMAKVETFLTKEQVAEAQRLAREFKPSAGEAASETQQTSTDFGFVTVTAEDNSSEIFADGKFMGNPPASLKLKPGQHVIEVKRAGFKDYRKEIHLTAGSELNVRATQEKR